MQQFKDGKKKKESLKSWLDKSHTCYDALKYNNPKS